MKTPLRWLKQFLPDREIDLKILRGPLRGGRFHSKPRSSLRKVFGIYEHELNGWLEAVLPKIDHVLDVGANDGYFTFGCAAAMRRLGKTVRVIAFEPNPVHVRQLEHARQATDFCEASIRIVPGYVGREAGPQTVALDQFISQSKGRALIKVDVEGAEVEVIAGGLAWLKPANFFLIEIHSYDYLMAVRSLFSNVGLQLVKVDQQPLPLLGRETRDARNWWLVTDLAKC